MEVALINWRECEYNLNLNKLMGIPIIGALGTVLYCMARHGTALYSSYAFKLYPCSIHWPFRINARTVQCSCCTLPVAPPPSHSALSPVRPPFRRLVHSTQYADLAHGVRRSDVLGADFSQMGDLAVEWDAAVEQAQLEKEEQALEEDELQEGSGTGDDVLDAWGPRGRGGGQDGGQGTSFQAAGSAPSTPVTKKQSKQRSNKRCKAEFETLQRVHDSLPEKLGPSVWMGLDWMAVETINGTQTTYKLSSPECADLLGADVCTSCDDSLPGP